MPLLHFHCALQAEQIKQTLEDYESSGVWNLERDARGNPSIVLGQDDVQ